MPTLNWIGKDKVINHHQDVPFRVLDFKYNHGARDTENMIIHGDNLDALKALLPKYEGRVKCVYIDPPYNTGNEGWVYNDNVNDPKIRKWLGGVVGREGEDLGRHDKWLCMMYPRLKLLQQLLAEDGIIFISVDDTEVFNLKFICDEIFGSANCIANIVWKKRYQGAKEKRVIIVQEYVLMYARNIEHIPELFVPSSDEMIKKYYKHTDEFSKTRGAYRTQPLEAGNSMEDRINLREPIPAPDGTLIYPRRQWIWSKSRIENALEHNEIGFSKKNETWTPFIKQYLIDRSGNQRMTKPFSLIDDIFTQDGTKEMGSLFDDTNIFPFPKPSKLIMKLIEMAYRDKDAIILDSFAGSGTTAHAVLNLNAQDGGNRKFILVEMMDYAETITAERVRRVIGGYAEKPGISAKAGGGFNYYELGEPLLHPDGNLNENISTSKIYEYIWFTETKTAYAQSTPHARHYLGTLYGTAYFFYYERDNVTILDADFLNTYVGPKAGIQAAQRYVIYADICAFDSTDLEQFNIIFKKIPRDISKL